MGFLLAKNWWVLVLRGLAGIAFGIVTFLWPRITLSALVAVFAAYALITGIMSIVAGVRAAEQHDRWVSLVIEGIVGVAACAVTLFWPAITVVALMFVIGIWAVMTGAFEIGTAIRLRRHISHEWLMILSGLCSIIFGILVVSVPVAGALVIALWIGAYAFVYGVLNVILGFRLHSIGQNLFSGPAMPAPAH